MATQTNLTLDLDSDMRVVMTIAGTGDISGQAFRAAIVSRHNPSAVVLAGTPVVTDGPNREVTWTLADTDTESIRAGTDYRYGIWRADASNEVPLAYGSCILRRLPGS